MRANEQTAPLNHSVLPRFHPHFLFRQSLLDLNFRRQVAVVVVVIDYNSNNINKSSSNRSCDRKLLPRHRRQEWRQHRRRLLMNPPFVYLRYFRSRAFVGAFACELVHMRVRMRHSRWRQQHTMVPNNQESRWAGPLACPFACSMAPLTHLLTPHCSLCSRAALRCAHLLACLLTYSLPRCFEPKCSA